MAPARPLYCIRAHGTPYDLERLWNPQDAILQMCWWRRHGVPAHIETVHLCHGETVESARIRAMVQARNAVWWAMYGEAR